MTAKDCPHTRRRKSDAHRGELPVDSAISPHRVSFASQRTSCEMLGGSAGRPGHRCAQVHRRRRQRSRVSGWTRKWPRRRGERSRLNHASTARSAGRRAGRATWRRKMQTSWPIMTTSMASYSCPHLESRSSWTRRIKARWRNKSATYPLRHQCRPTKGQVGWPGWVCRHPQAALRRLEFKVAGASTPAAKLRQDPADSAT